MITITTYKKQVIKEQQLTKLSKEELNKLLAEYTTESQKATADLKKNTIRITVNETQLAIKDKKTKNWFFWPFSSHNEDDKEIYEEIYNDLFGPNSYSKKAQLLKK